MLQLILAILISMGASNIQFNQVTEKTSDVQQEAPVLMGLGEDNGGWTGP